MRSGVIVFTGMERVVFGRPAAEAVAETADRLGARRVFILAGRTLNRETDAVRQIAGALGAHYTGTHDEMPAHSPRDAVIACANKARDAGCDLLLSVGGGSATDGGKAVTICLEHDIREPDGLEPFRTVVDEITGKRSFPQYRAPRVRQICVPTTLSGGEFNARAGIRNNLIPYASASAGIQDALGGRVDAIIVDLAATTQYIKHGDLRLLATTSARRLKGSDSTPALSEKLPGFDMPGWFAVVAPTGTPKAVVARVNSDINAALAEPELAEKITVIGPIVDPGKSPEQVAEFLRHEHQRWSEIAKEIGLLPE